MTISDVLREAFLVYRRLLGTSVVVAGLISAVVSLADALASESATGGTLLVSLALGLIGSRLVQGALVEVVRDLHEGRAPASVGAYYQRTRSRLGTLVGVSILSGLGVALGVVLLIVPGLIAIARWSLVVPLVMIEGRGWRDAFARSSELVRGKTGRVLAVVVVANILAGIAAFAVTSVFSFFPTFLAVWLGGTVAGALVVPFEAHTLTVLYYRLTEPERPVLPDEPVRETWPSVWREEERDGPN